MDIRPPRPRRPAPLPTPTQPLLDASEPEPLLLYVNPPDAPKKQGTERKTKKFILGIVLGLLALIIAACVGMLVWYTTELSPVDSKSTTLEPVGIVPNMSPSEIGELLKDTGVIKNAQAFVIYTRISGTQNSLQAGSYRLSPAESTPQIVEHLTKGSVDTFNITFLPGATLAENKEVLRKAGYTNEEIATGFAAIYDSPLFATKLSGTDLEGYIYGETYNFAADASVKDILKTTFAQYEKIIDENDLITRFKAQGLSLYEGITLASIIQRESIGGDEAQIAQVFYSRLAIGMALGSDVTYQYIADKTGVERDTNLDSPYNTRRYTGLPPGPISVPGIRSLLAVAEPAKGDYLFFLSGDDDVTYYGRTLAEHEANIAAHCKVKCGII
jgi:UPF0755 protein